MLFVMNKVNAGGAFEMPKRRAGGGGSPIYVKALDKYCQRQYSAPEPRPSVSDPAALTLAPAPFALQSSGTP